jgi:tyrosyl-tRNA synthetase
MADYSMIMLDERSLTLQGFCPGFGSAAGASAPPAAPTAPAAPAGGGGGNVVDIEAGIAAKGEAIRALKAKKAAKDQIMPLVTELNDLKKQFFDATGKKWEPPAKGSGGGGGAGADIDAKIAAKGGEIRELKAKKAAKDQIMPLVAELNDLKKQFFDATGKKWEPGASGGGDKKKDKGKDAKDDKDKPLTKEQQANFDLIRSVGEECITEDDLRTLLKQKPAFNLYDGFEPSGRMHIAQGVFKAMNVNKCTKAGGTFYFWVADWFALMNDKMGGDLDKIKVVGKYLIEVWKASGMDMDGVVFRWASDDITNEAATYWPKMLDIARRFNITRIKKCCQIMGRLEGNLTAAQILYPLMQCTDVFFLKADICQLGVDQRKVNMLAREYCDAAKVKLKPVILSHHMLYGLKAGQEKMSKSDPDSAIFMEDTVEDVERKINNAYCPQKPAEETKKKVTDDAGTESMHLVEDDLKNPCLDYIQHIILCPPGATFTAGGKTYKSFPPIKADFVSGKLPEKELKASLITAVNLLLDPVRAHFSKGEPKKLLAQIVQWKKENLQPKEGSFPRLAYTDPKKGDVFAVFAPMPTEAKTTLGTALSLLQQIKAAPKGSQTVLWLSDWSAFVLNCLDAEPKLIRASFTLLVEAAKAIDPGTMSGVEVVWQSEAILTNPSDYWISVINVGRKFQLETIREVDQANTEVGQVISSLMHVGDVLGLGAKVIAGSEAQKLLHSLPEKYYKLAGTGKVKVPVPTPEVLAVPSMSTELKQPSADGKTADDAEIFLTDDPKVGVSKRIKKAFCEPENVEYNPPLTIACNLGIELEGSFTVERKSENGGDQKYTDKEKLVRELLNASCVHTDECHTDECHTDECRLLRLPLPLTSPFYTSVASPLLGC